MRLPALLLTACALTSACSSKPKDPTPVPPAPTGTTSAFELDEDLGSSGTFWDFPIPSDLRLSAAGTPDLTGYPNPQRVDLVKNLLVIAQERKGWPMVPTAYFSFSAAVSTQSADAVIAADKASPVLLIDVDPASSDRGQLLPTAAESLVKDGFTSPHLLAVIPYPGVVLHPKRTYAFVVRRSLNDAAGQPLGVPAGLWALAHAQAVTGARAAGATTSYQPLWDTLKTLSIDPETVAAATVFTTGDVVADLAALTDAMKPRYPLTLPQPALPTAPGLTADHEGYCELGINVTYPKFQQGTPPFDTQGTFAPGADGLPTQQGTYDAVPVVLTLPHGEMPAGGYPLVMYFHGSGGVSRATVDRGVAVTHWTDGGPVLPDGGFLNTPGLGPAWVVAPYGFATAASALPLNPERMHDPNVSETLYLNIANLAAFRDTFRQGVIEQRLLIEALKGLQFTLSAADQATCHVSLPSGQTSFHYNPDQLFAQGQSMGGMYTNLIGATEPRVKAAVPTGAGGFWQLFITTSPQVPQVLLPGLLGTGGSADLKFTHPALSLLEMAWEPAEPFVYMPRLAKRPLAGHPVRPIYEPVGTHDSYFPEVLYTAIALSYGHKEAGTVIWPEMQERLKLGGLDGLTPFPVTDELTSETGAKYTGAILQYADPTGYDGHALYSQVPEVQHQYGCFLSTFLKTGHATIVAPGPVGSPCQ
jgi:hypothetical protein